MEMDLTPEQYEKITAFLRDKWSPDFSCPCCRSRMWNGSSKIFQITEMAPQGVAYFIPPSFMPLVPLSCSNCGFTVLLNALTVGVISKEAAEKAPPVGISTLGFGNPAAKSEFNLTSELKTKGEVKAKEGKSGG